MKMHPISMKLYEEVSCTECGRPADEDDLNEFKEAKAQGKIETYTCYKCFHSDIY